MMSEEDIELSPKAKNIMIGIGIIMIFVAGILTGMKLTGDRFQTEYSMDKLDWYIDNFESMKLIDPGVYQQSIPDLIRTYEQFDDRARGYVAGMINNLCYGEGSLPEGIFNDYYDIDYNDGNRVMEIAGDVFE